MPVGNYHTISNPSGPMNNNDLPREEELTTIRVGPSTSSSKPSLVKGSNQVVASKKVMKGASIGSSGPPLLDRSGPTSLRAESGVRSIEGLGDLEQ
mmetsp:Transcript_6794/g.10952  ORF Transcript_6794/g.10952 Transcript_6794/m.10952 type:complete len:96 (-) Transcript_6794:93-380(-)